MRPFLAPSPLHPRWLLLFALAAAWARPSPDWPGIKSWVRESFPKAPLVTVDELEARLEDPKAPQPVLLDARTREEFEVSHLPGARWAPDAKRALRALEGVDRRTPVVVYCSVGYRSGELTTELRERGLTNVRNLEGSLFEWANRGLPLVSGDGRPTHIAHPFDEKWGRLLLRRLWSPGR